MAARVPQRAVHGPLSPGPPSRGEVSQTGCTSSQRRWTTFLDCCECFSAAKEVLQRADQAVLGFEKLVLETDRIIQGSEKVVLDADPFVQGSDPFFLERRRAFEPHGTT
ncbi:MAG: hypothetical protein ACYDCL_16480 [Myxococcales bacterium]